MVVSLHDSMLGTSPALCGPLKPAVRSENTKTVLSVEMLSPGRPIHMNVYGRLATIADPFKCIRPLGLHGRPILMYPAAWPS